MASTEIVSKNLNEFQGLRQYVNNEFLEQIDVSLLDKKDRFQAKQKNVRNKNADNYITKIDNQIDILKNMTFKIKDENYQAYLVDEENDVEVFFVNDKNNGWVDFFRNKDDVWVRCKLKNGTWLFYEAGPLFEKYTETTKYLIISKPVDWTKYKAYSNTGNMNEKMKKDSQYFKVRNMYFNRMWNSRAQIFKNYFKNNEVVLDYE